MMTGIFVDFFLLSDTFLQEIGLLGHAGMDGQQHYLQAASEEHNSIFKKLDDIKGCKSLVFK